jgi:hypothetical protein
LPSFLVGLAETGDESPEKVVSRGEGADAVLSDRVELLTTRFAVCSGLGVITVGSFDGIFFWLATESIDERLELLACPRCFMREDAVLDRRLVISGASGVLCPPRMDSAELPEFPLFRAGRMA